MLFTLRSGGTAHPETSVLQNITDLISSSGVLSIAGTQFFVQAQAVPDMTLKVKIGRAYIKGSLTNSYPVRSDADDSVAIVPNSSGNPRIDTVVLYIDLSAAANTDASNVAKLIVVQGTPAASPVPPTTSVIQTAVGSANPFITLANVSVASGATSITNPNITDIRTQAIFTIGGGGSVSFINNEAPVGAVDGVNLTFTAAFPYVGGSLMVFRDGQLMTPTAGFDYTETSPATGVLTFFVAPAIGSIIRITYQKVVSTAGNADTVDGFHASSVPTVNQIPVLDSGAKMPLSTEPVAWVDLVDAATIDIDLSLGKKFRVTIAGNRTFTVSNVVIGKSFILRIKQDGVGTRTAIFFATVSWPNGVIPTLTTTPNKADNFGFTAQTLITFDGFVVGQNQ